MKPIKVLCVDDHTQIREYMHTLLELEDDIELVGEAVNGWEAVEKASHLLPDVVLMDVNLPALSGIDAARLIREQYPWIGLVFIAGEDIWRSQALEVGGSAYIVKDIPPDELIHAIRGAMQSPLGVKPWPTPEPLGRLKEAWRGMWRGARPIAVLRVLGLIALCVIGVTIFHHYLPLLRYAVVHYSVAAIALSFGLMFFIYAMKYYGTAALILLFNGANGLVNGGNGNGIGLENATGPLQLFQRFNGNGNRKLNGNGDSNEFDLEYEPFVSIHLAMYNESSVVDRLLTACTSLDYENYEVIAADDSTDETVQRLEEWAKHPRVKVSHRENRDGFKGGALQEALEQMNPWTEFVMVFDADFIPPPGIIWQCLAYFYGVDGSNNSNTGNKNKVNNKYMDDRIAVVQGYQWHMLNAGENWITKGVRAEFSGSYVIERPGQELFGSMKMISGSAYMIRADVLRKLGWGTSITEDWELTLRLYLDGYKVLYTPYVAAPAECVSDFRRLTRQRMRWAEGHTFNVKKFFHRILACPYISWAEKLEFLYYAPYYLQSFFFCMGTACWLISEVILRQRFPYWTALWGWSLVFSNSLALVLMNLSGLFLENSVRTDAGGVLSALVLSNLLVPFQAYAALKGLLEKEEGGWFRTPKSGKITEALGKLWLGKKLRRLLPKKKKGARKAGRHSAATQRRKPRLRLAPVAIALIVTLILYLWRAAGSVQATPGNSSTFWFYNQDTPLRYMMYQSQPTNSEQSRNTSFGITFYSDTFDDSQELYAGTATVYAYFHNFSFNEQEVDVTLYVDRNGSEVATLGGGTITIPAWVTTPTLYSTTFSHTAFDFQAGDRLKLRIQSGLAFVRMYWDGQYNDSQLQVGMVVSENLIALLLLAPFIPIAILMLQGRKRRLSLAVTLIAVTLAAMPSLTFIALNKVEAAADNSSVFSFYDDTSPLTYMMYQSQPNGSEVSQGEGTVEFYSDTFSEAKSLSSGTATVCLVSEGGKKAKQAKLKLHAGQGGNWKKLGSDKLEVPEDGPKEIRCVSFSHSAYDFAEGDRLRLEVKVKKDVFIYWDGASNDSRLEVGMIVPEVALVLIPIGLAIPGLIKKVWKGRPQIQRGDR